jgi:hypothetical protein
MAAPFSAYQRPEMATSSTTLLPQASLTSLTSRGSSPVRFFSPFVYRPPQLSQPTPQGSLFIRQGTTLAYPFAFAILKFPIPSVCARTQSRRMGIRRINDECTRAR